MASRRDERGVSVGGQISIGTATAGSIAAQNELDRKIEDTRRALATGFKEFAKASREATLTAQHASAFEATSARFAALKEEARLASAEQGNYGDYPNLVRSAGRQALTEQLNYINDPDLRRRLRNNFNSYLVDQEINSYGEARTYQINHSKMELDNSLKRMAAGATGSDPVQNQALLKEADSSIKGAVEAGLMTKEEAQQAKEATGNAIVQKMVEENPRGAKLFLESPEAKATLGDIRTSQLHARTIQKIKTLKVQQEAADREKKRQIGLQISRAEDSIEKGIPLEPEIVDGLNIAALETGDKGVYSSVQRLQEKNRVTQEFMRLTPREQETAINMLKGTNLELDNHLRKVNSNVKASIKKDPYAAAISMGIIEGSDLLDMDEGLGQQLSKRMAATAVAEDRLGTKIMPMTNAELDSLQEKFESSSYQERVAIASDLVSGLGSKSMDIFKELNKRGSGTLAFAGTLANEGQLGTATQIFRGQDLRKTNKEMIPQFKGNVDAVELEQELPEYALGGQRAATVEAARNIYLSMSAQENDYSGEFNEDRYERALQLATNGGAIGYNDSQIEPPVMGMDEDDFEAWVEGVSTDQINKLGGIHAVAPGKYKEIIRDSNLRNVGRGQYLVMVPVTIAGETMEKPLLKNNGDLFVLDYNALNTNTGMKEATGETNVGTDAQKFVEQEARKEIKTKNKINERTKINNLMANALTGEDERVSKTIEDNIRKAAPKADPKIAKVFDDRRDILEEYGITEGKRMDMFLAQMAHESNGFRNMTEMLSDDEAEVKYSYITKVGRMLGNTQPGDGAKYKGRGLIQLTGRWNYKHYGSMIGVDLINNPEKAAEPDVALRIAAAFWKSKGLNKLADKGDYKAITKKINGGYNGHEDRKIWLSRFKGESK